LLSFEGIPLEDKVRLDWVTASEINNDYFTVEKSRDGMEFFPIGKVEGADNSTEIRPYSLDDMDPIFGISYYRLRQTDFDGAFTTSEIIAVNYKKKISQYSVFPNPATDKVYLISSNTEPSQVSVRDLNGKEIINFSIEENRQSGQMEIAGLA
jgi:hypothetical protein